MCREAGLSTEKRSHQLRTAISNRQEATVTQVCFLSFSLCGYFLSFFCTGSLHLGAHYQHLGPVCHSPRCHDVHCQHGQDVHAGQLGGVSRLQCKTTRIGEQQSQEEGDRKLGVIPAEWVRDRHTQTRQREIERIRERETEGDQRRNLLGVA